MLIWVAALSFLVGILEVGLPSRLAFVPAAIAKDQTIPVLMRLKELSEQDGTLTDLHSKGEASSIVFSPDVGLIALLPTWTSQGTLLDNGGLDFGHVSQDERKKFFYMHLYYSKVEAETLRYAVNKRDQFTLVMIFGYGKIFPALSSGFRRIQPDEVEREVQAYEAYVNSFSRAEVLKRPITYAVVPTEGSFDFSNLDHWYERDAGERLGAYTLFRMKLRS